MERETKSERITFLVTPEFKAHLARLASRENVSVGELIRSRFDQGPDLRDVLDERVLQGLTAEPLTAFTEARASLQDGIAEVE